MLIIHIFTRGSDDKHVRWIVNLWSHVCYLKLVKYVTAWVNCVSLMELIDQGIIVAEHVMIVCVVQILSTTSLVLIKIYSSFAGER